MDEPETTTSAPSLDASSPPPGGVKPSQIPDLMKIGAAPVNELMEVDTDILEPVVFSETFARFRLQNKGILHSNSKLTFALDTSTSAAHGGMFPLNIGVHSLIDRCVLKSGTKTICETSDFNQFMAFRSSFINPQHNKERESITTARMMCRKWEYNDGAATLSEDGPGAGVSDVNASAYCIDTGIEVNRLGKAVGDRETELPYYNFFNQGPSASGAQQRTQPIYQIALNDLFPFLKMNQLPLYMMKEELDIELYFAVENRRACWGQATDDFSWKMDRNACKMVADYIHYPQEMMDAYANANSKMSFTYVDYRLVKRTVDKTDGAKGQNETIILNVGGAGRIVNKMFFALENKVGVINPERSIMNRYVAQGGINAFVGDATDNVNNVIHNVRYNDNFLYPVDITNNSRLFSNIQQSEGSVPFISNDEYSDQLKLISGNKFNGYVLSDALKSQSFYTEDRLNRNERINSRGIELYQTWKKLPFGTANNKYTLRVWLEVVRSATLEDGILTPSWA